MPRSVDTTVAVQPDGRVLFTEVDLSEGTGPTPPKANRINWVEQGGAFVPQFIGGSVVNDGSGRVRRLTLEATDDDTGQLAELFLVARGLGAVTPSAVQVAVDPPQANTPSVLINENGASDWVSCMGTPFGQKKRIMEGPFSSAAFALGPGAAGGLGNIITLGIPWTTFAIVLGGIGGGAFTNIYTWGWTWINNSTAHIDVTNPSAFNPGANTVTWNGMVLHD